MNYGKILSFSGRESSDSSDFIGGSVIYLNISQFREKFGVIEIIEFLEEKEPKLLFSTCFPNNGMYCLVLGFKSSNVSEIANEIFRFLSKNTIKFTICPCKINAEQLLDVIGEVFQKEKPIQAPKIEKIKNLETDEIQEETAEIKQPLSSNAQEPDDYGINIPSDDEIEVEKPQTTNSMPQKSMYNPLMQPQIGYKNRSVDVLNEWKRLAEERVQWDQQCFIGKINDDFGVFGQYAFTHPTNYQLYKGMKETEAFGLPSLSDEKIDTISRYYSLFDA